MITETLRSFANGKLVNLTNYVSNLTSMETNYQIAKCVFQILPQKFGSYRGPG